MVRVVQLVLLLLSIDAVLAALVEKVGRLAHDGTTRPFHFQPPPPPRHDTNNLPSPNMILSYSANYRGPLYKTDMHQNHDAAVH
jgi:hypothetical protein